MKPIDPFLPTSHSNTLRKLDPDRDWYNAGGITYWEAKEWLWEKHKISFMLFHFNETYNCEVSIEDAVLVEDENYFDSPITAEKEGINKAIGYLHSQLNPQQ